MDRLIVFVIMASLFSLSLYADEGFDLMIKADKEKIALSEADKDVLKNGELGTGRYVVGGILGTYPIGFGVGHAIQGRWGTRGWMMTTGELASVAVFVMGANKCMDSLSFNSDDGSFDCSDGGLVAIGILGYVGFRIWEIVDVWYGGYKQREEYDYLKKKVLGNTPAKVSWFAAPLVKKDGGGLAVGLTF